MTNDHRRPRPVRHRRIPGPGAVWCRLGAWLLLSVAFLLMSVSATILTSSAAGAVFAALLGLGAGHTALGLFALARRAR